MDVEKAIREAVARGITHLTLHPVQSEDGKTTYWRCSATPSTMHKYVSVTHTDPIEAMVQTLKAMPKAGRRTSSPEPKCPFPDMGAEIGLTPLTAAVTPEPTPTDPDEWSRFK